MPITRLKTIEKKELARPEWIRGRVSSNESFQKVYKVLKKEKVHTVCTEAACPNKGECWKNSHVTFIILGEVCTRGCQFCNIKNGKPLEIDKNEPERIARVVKKLAKKYVIITSVTRDDLEDEGVGHFLQVIKSIKKNNPETFVEILVPDFSARKELIQKISDSSAVVIAHNIEMPERLYKEIRKRSDYRKSLETLRILNENKESAGYLIKSSIMVGVGETTEEIYETIHDLKNVGVDIVYIGQYLSPSKKHWPVKKYYTPEEFNQIGHKAEEIGIKVVSSGPMVRSSYKAYESYNKANSITLTT